MDELDAAFKSGRGRFVGGNLIALAQAHMLGEHLANHADTNSTYLAAAEQLGYAYEIAIRIVPTDGSHSNRDIQNQLLFIQYEIIEILGYMYTKYRTTDSDKASDIAASLMKRSALGFTQTGHLQRAAIAYTNAAAATLEKSTLSAKELSRIKKLIDFSFHFKQLDSLEWAYSQAVLGMYYERLPSADIDEHLDHLRLSRQSSLRALTLFKDHDTYPSMLALASISRVERELFDTNRRRERSLAVLDHLDEIPEPVREAASQLPEVFADSLESNPTIFGLADAPQWLSPRRDDPPNSADASMLLAARQRLIDSDRAQIPDLDDPAHLTYLFEAAEINIALQSYPDAYEEFLDIIEKYGAKLEPEEFIRRGLTTIGLAEHANENPPTDLLLQVADAFKRVVDKRDKKQLEAFLHRNPAYARFVACELSMREMWTDAIALIENTRALLYSDHLTELEQLQSDTPAATVPTQWIYVTHSSKGTFVLLRDEAAPQATGKFIPELTGSHLSEIQFSVAYESLGLTHSQEPGVAFRHLNDATVRAIEVLRPITRAVDELASKDRGICLILGGLYMTLPVSSALGTNASNSYPYIAVVPSSSRTARDHVDIVISEGAKLVAMSASSASDMPTLTYPEHEVDAVRKFSEHAGMQSRMVIDTSRDQFHTALGSANVVHYCGHSFSDPWEPLKGAFVLNDGRYSVADILSTLPTQTLSLTTMSSCQSGQPSTGVLADELISLNSALLYRGCRFVVSTLWPVLDVASYVLMCRFYWALSRHHRLSLGHISTCLLSTQQWVRESTTAEVSVFMREQGLKVPDFLQRQADDATPFDHPRVWAAYYLSARSL